MKRTISLFLCAALLLGTLIFSVGAAATTPKGSISLTLTYESKPVAGGKLTLYQVADFSTSAGSLSITPTKDFPELLIHDNFSSPVLAEALANYAATHNTPGITFTISQSGTVLIDDLPLGLYLLTQSEAAPGFSPFAPFLVTVPIQTGTGYDYTVDATPKIGTTPEPTVPPETTAPTVPVPTTPGGSSGGKLPQTGMANWPIPILAIVGLLLFLSGWCLYRSGRKDRYES